MQTLNTFLKIYLIFNYMCVCTNTCPQSLGKALDLVEMELQAVVSNLIWILEAELGVSARAVHPLKH